jgi:hypothetical protein
MIFNSYETFLLLVRKQKFYLLKNRILRSGRVKAIFDRVQIWKLLQQIKQKK